MILSDREIQAAIRDKNILIDPPPDEALFSSTALDLTLDVVLLRWKELGNHPSGQPIKLCPSREGFDIRAMMTDPHYSAKVAIDPKQGFDLEPHKFVLGYTQEKIYLPEPVEDCGQGRGEEQPRPARRRCSCDGSDDPRLVRL